MGGKVWLFAQGLVAIERNVAGKLSCTGKTGFLFQMLSRCRKQNTRN